MRRLSHFGISFSTSSFANVRSVLSLIRRERRGNSFAFFDWEDTDGKLIAEIHREGEVIDQRAVGDRLVLRARVDERLAGRLRRAGAEVKRERAPGT